MDFEVMKAYLPRFWDALLLTLRIGWQGVALSLVLGVACAVAVHWKIPVLRQIVGGYIELFLKKTGLGSFITDFECAGNTGHPKGYNIRLVADRNHLEHPVYVGDIDGDRVASEEAGVPFCHASYGFGEVDHADYVIKNFSELKSIFE